MSCTFKQYLADSYKLKKVKDLKSLKSKKTVHGMDWGNDGAVGFGESWYQEDEEEQKKEPDLKKDVDSEDETDYNELSTHKDEPEKEQDPDKQGLIKKIDGAHLVYKRVNEDGTYDELWMYNISRGHNDEYTIRSAILANTDIEQKSGVSASGKQKYTLWTSGDVQMMQVTGLPN